MKNKFKINLSIFCFIFYIIFIILNDYICFIFKLEASICTYFSSFLLMLIPLLYLLKKRIKIEIDKFNKIDIIFLILLLFILMQRIAIPDVSFDTLNYHIFMQENLFSDNVSFNFFPARWINTFSLPLGDRLHYFFRLLLGYRLGTIFNLICVMVIYYQLKRLLSKFMKRDNLICICSIIIIVTEQILTNMITYYVDLFVIPIILEIIMMLFEKNKSKINNYFVLLLAGIAISLKVSNAIILIPLAIIYLYKNKNTINYKTFIIGIPILIFPFAIYMINNYIQTGNPVFPFYNSIFKSDYFNNINWIEDAYGPKTIIERIFWPIYIIFNPRRAFDTDIYYGRIGFGYIISIITIIIEVIRHYKKPEKYDLLFSISCLYIILCIIWSNFMMGYIRYALVLEIISGIVGIFFIYKYYNKGKILSILSIFALLSFMYGSIYTISDIIGTNREISWRYPYKLNKESYKENFKYILNRKRDYSEVMAPIDCLGIVDYNAGYASMITDKIPIIDMHEGYANKYGKKMYDKRIKLCKNIYTISTTPTLYRTLEYINKIGYETTGKSIYIKTDFIDVKNDLILIEIKKGFNK